MFDDRYSKNSENQAVDEMCNYLVRDYVVSVDNPKYINIEEFVEKKLGCEVLYEHFAGTDRDALGFISDGKTAVEIFRDGNKQIVVFSPNTIVLDSILLEKENEAQRRFTLAHEAGHILSSKMFGTTLSGFDYDDETVSKMDYASMKKRTTLNEIRADKFASSLLIPTWLIGETMRKFHSGLRIRRFGKHLILPDDMKILNKMASSLKVSYLVLYYRLSELNGFVDCPEEDYYRLMGLD